MQKALTAKSVENGQNWVENASKYRRIKRQTQLEVTLRRQARGQVAGIARSMSRKIAIKAFAAGRQGLPLLSQNPGVELHKSAGISTVERRFQARFAAAVMCWIERANEANEKARRGCCGGPWLFCSQRGTAAPG
jgi:hypothetical protein